MMIGEVAFRSRTRLQAAQRVNYELPLTHKSGQDFFVADLSEQRFAVADGVGGSPDGALAAQRACEVFRERAPSYRLGVKAVMEALPILYNELHTAVAETGSQTTFSGGVITDDGYLAWLHTGDSRLFYLPACGDLYELSQPQHDPGRRHVLSNALGGDHAFLTLKHNKAHPQLPMWGHERLSAGDRIVMATDGIGPAGVEDINSEYQWWMTHVARSAGEMAVQVLARVFEESYIIDDATLGIIDIDD